MHEEECMNAAPVLCLLPTFCRLMHKWELTHCLNPVMAKLWATAGTGLGRLFLPFLTPSSCPRFHTIQDGGSAAIGRGEGLWDRCLNWFLRKKGDQEGPTRPKAKIKLTASPCA